MESTGNSPFEIVGHYSVPVYYEDTDFSGRVYHSNFLKYFERGREHLIGIPFLQEMYAKSIHFVVSRAELAYYKGAAHGDTMYIRTKAEIGTSPIMNFEQEVFLEESMSERSIVAGKIKLVLIGDDGRPTKPPAYVLEHLRRQGD